MRKIDMAGYESGNNTGLKVEAADRCCWNCANCDRSGKNGKPECWVAERNVEPHAVCRSFCRE